MDVYAELAQYVAPKRRAVEHSGDVGGSTQTFLFGWDRTLAVQSLERDQMPNSSKPLKKQDAARLDTFVPDKAPDRSHFGKPCMRRYCSSGRKEKYERTC